MDPGDSAEPSREELESRVAELEQTVSKMLPDRRGVLKGLGAAAIGAGVASSGASGQSAAGQVGTESEPVDVEGAQGNFDSVSTDHLYTTERSPTVVISKDSGGTIYASGKNGEISSGSDAQTVFQSVADHLITIGGGSIYIKEGDYELTGYDPTTLSYIDFGANYSGDKMVPIEIHAEGAGTGTNGDDLQTNAVRFKIPNDNAEANVVDVFSFGGNVAKSDTMRNLHPHIRGITILTPDDPNLRAIDAHNASCAEIENCTISPDLTVSNISEPTSPSQGILLPQVGNHANVRVRQTNVFGMFYGVGYADHARLEQTNLAYNKVALLANAVNNAARFDGVTVEGCEYLHFFAGSSCNVTGNMTIEFYNKGGWNDRATFDVATGATPEGAGPLTADAHQRMSIDYIQITPNVGAEFKPIETTNGDFTLDQRWNQIHPTPAPSSISVGSSPFTYTNNDGWDQMVTVSGGSVNDISLRGQSTGLTSGTFEVQPGESLTIDYTSAPTLYKFAR